MCSLRFREKLKTSVAGQILFDEPLSRHTSWKVGGPAEILFMPVSTEDLSLAVSMAWEEKLPVTVLGNGTNILVSDKGVPGLIVKLQNFRHLELKDSSIIAGAGINLPEISMLALERNLSGLEFAVGIPASVGGAVVSNAGAHGSSMEDIVEWVLIMDYRGEIELLEGADLDFRYRSSSLNERRFIVLEAGMVLKPMSGEEIKIKMNHYLEVRRKTQPLGCATAGSVFVNPTFAPAGLLIEKAGLKGMKEGGARISEKHANFIENADHATAEDIIRLIRRIQEKVYTMFNVRLETEIRFLGEVP